MSTVELPTDDATFRRIVIEEARGTAPVGLTDLLTTDAPRWKLALADGLEEANLHLSQMKSSWATFCTGTVSTDTFRRRRSAHEHQRAQTLSLKRALESRLRHVNALLSIDRGGRNGSKVNPWKALCEWILSDYEDDEWDELFDRVPEGLRETLELLDQEPQAAAGA